MSLSMYEASVPVFVAMLGNLSKLLDKGEAFAEDRKIDKQTSTQLAARAGHASPDPPSAARF